MMKTTCLKLAAAIACAALLLSPAVRAADKPNLVFINSDDLGYADIGPFGSTINLTPNLDRMAKEGRRLTCHYAAPVCSPSRAALMTGCYPKRVLPIPGVLFPGAAVGLNPEEHTVAELLKDAGYTTAIIGKWHLGDQPEFLPRRRGFDYYVGLPYSNDMGPGEEGAKSNLGDPLPTPKANAAGRQDETGIMGPHQPPLPLLRNDTVIERNGRPRAALIPIEDYGARQDELCRLRAGRHGGGNRDGDLLYCHHPGCHAGTDLERLAD